MNDCLRQEIHVWLARPESWPLATVQQWYLPLLSEEEQQRCRRFHFEHDRKHYLTAHAMLRLCLAHHLGCDPQQVELAVGRNGKPELVAQSFEAPLSFNLSHTRGMVACIVTSGRACGIDVEGIQLLPEMAGMAQTVYSEKENSWLARQQTTQSQSFFALWTLKEAYIKATGLGMSAPLRQISIDPQYLSVNDDSRPAQDADSWLLDYWQPGPGHALALACENARAGADAVQAIVYQELDLATGKRHVLRRRDIDDRP